MPWTITHQPDAVTAVRGDEAITLVTTGPRAGRLWVRRGGDRGSVLVDDCHLALAALLTTAAMTTEGFLPSDTPLTRSSAHGHDEEAAR